MEKKECENINRNGIKKSQSTGDNLSEGSNASNSNSGNFHYRIKSPMLKKGLSPRLKGWEKIEEDMIEEFDLFQFENVEELVQNELNKYQGLSTFVKNVEKEEKPRFSLFKKNMAKLDVNVKPKYITKTHIFNEIHPPQLFLRSISNNIDDNETKVDEGLNKKHNSETTLPIDHNLQFLDTILKSGNMTSMQESTFKVLKMKISSQSLSESRREVRKFGPWGDIWEEKEEFIRQNSPYGHFLSYKLRPIIVKGGDDLRQEIIAMQLIRRLQLIFKEVKIMAYLRPYEVIVTSANSGIIGYNLKLNPIYFFKSLSRIQSV